MSDLKKILQGKSLKQLEIERRTDGLRTLFESDPTLIGLVPFIEEIDIQKWKAHAVASIKKRGAEKWMDDLINNLIASYGLTKEMPKTIKWFQYPVVVGEEGVAVLISIVDEAIKKFDELQTKDKNT